MNKKFEKWLTIAALGSWVASMGALVAIEVASTQVTSDLSLSSESQATRSYGRRAQFASVLDSQFYQQLKQSDAVIGLEPDRGHWLDHTLISHEILNRDFSGSDVKSLPSSEEMLIHDHKLRSVWMLAQIPESWHRLPNK
jgi:hypothetical protein